MKRFLFTALLIVVILSLVACSNSESPEQIDPVAWSISASPPPLTEDAYHFLYLHGVQEIYLYLGMTREEARNFIPNIGDGNSVSSPQFGAIGFDDDDRINLIMIFAVRWTTPSGIVAGSYWSELEERFDTRYNLISGDSGFSVYLTRNHVPVHPESEEWGYRSYSVSFNGDNRIGMITIESRRE